MLNNSEKIETFAGENSLGYRIPDNNFSPRYLPGDILIFQGLTPEEIQPNLLLLLYGENDYHIGKSDVNLQVHGIPHPYNGYHIGLIEQIVPA